ncbi:thioredoxin, mitochondrial [Trichuris trichiura]|uniref:Thioredoxin, mitochondrial n=1 Tax=Trichuris trichiura TaxID=36087 RepID=A0A077ZIA0_TRITR|nr:thioredoxin, mitochondrial [Trichuris trichiura]
MNRLQKPLNASLRLVRSLFTQLHYAPLSCRLLASGRFCRTSVTSGAQQRFMRPLCTDRPTSSFSIQDYEDFKERVLNSDRPVAVQFHADWCGPCKLLGPRLESIVDNTEGDVLLARLNVDDCADLAMEYGVQSIPTVLGFRDGEIVEKIVGVVDDETIRNFVDKLSSDE